MTVARDAFVHAGLTAIAGAVALTAPVQAQGRWTVEATPILHIHGIGAAGAAY